MRIEQHPVLVQAYKDYMAVRVQVRNGLRGSGAVRAYANNLRAVYRALAGKDFQ